MTTRLSNASGDLIKRLKATDWLANCGRDPCPDDIGAYLFVKKSEAGTLLLSKDWDDAVIDARNGCSTTLPQIELRRWNDVAKSVGEALRENGCSDDASRAVAAHFGLEYKKVELVISGYFHFACVELEYSGFLKPGFFSELCHICMLGRLPCGLTSEFPNGKLIIY